MKQSHGRVRTMAETQNKSDRHEAMKEAENYLQKSVLPKLEEPQWI